MQGKESASAGVRERVWVTVVDHEADPPRPVKEVFVENGRVVSVTDVVPDDPSPPGQLAALLEDAVRGRA